VSDDPDIKRIAEQQDTIITFAVGYFILGPVEMLAVVALIAWVIP
jgi:hypothetical protein